MRRWLGGALPVLVLAVAGSLFETYRYVSHSAPRQPPLEAATRLLEAGHLEVRRVDAGASLFPLPGSDRVLVFGADRGALEDRQVEAILRWVADGGRAVIAARPLHYQEDPAGPGDCEEAGEAPPESADPGLSGCAESGYDAADLRRNDPLLYALGVTAWQVPVPGHLRRLPPSLAEARTADFTNLPILIACQRPTGEERPACDRMLCGDPALDPVYSRVVQDGAVRRFEFDPADRLLHRDQFAAEELAPEDPVVPPAGTRLVASASNGRGAQLLQLALGDGDVYVLADLELWHNERLAYLDHAWLLERLAGDAAELWLIERMEMPSFITWLWQRAWPALASLLVLAFFWLWYRLPRRGVVLAPEPLHQRDFLDHLGASALFLWHHRRTEAVLAGLRRQVRRALQRHLGEDEGGRVLEVAAARTRLEPGQIREALEQVPRDERELTNIVETLQLLRSRL